MATIRNIPSMTPNSAAVPVWQELSDHQWFTMLCTRRISAILSILASSTVLFIILSDRKRKLAIVKNRLMTGMSIMDICHSIGLAIAMTSVPSHSELYGAMGNTSTCDVQGFVITLGALASVMYNAALCIMYVRMIRYNVTNETLIRHRIDTKLQISIFFIAVSYSFLAAILGQFNGGRGGCFLKAHPYGCDDKDSTVPCTRGTHVFLFTILGAIVLILCFLIIVISMKMIYAAVHKQTITMKKYGSGGVPWGRQKLAEEKTETAIQAALYVASYFITYIWLYALNYPFFSSDGSPWGLRLLNALFGPLQGFWNAVVFIRPIYVKHRKDSPDTGCWNALRSTVFCQEPYQPKYVSRRNSLLL